MIADHSTVLANLQVSKPPTGRKKCDSVRLNQLTMRNWYNICQKSYQTSSYPKDVSEAFSLFGESISTALDKHAPFIRENYFHWTKVTMVHYRSLGGKEGKATNRKEMEGCKSRGRQEIIKINAGSAPSSKTDPNSAILHCSKKVSRGTQYVLYN